MTLQDLRLSGVHPKTAAEILFANWKRAFADGDYPGREAQEQTSVCEKNSLGFLVPGMGWRV